MFSALRDLPMSGYFGTEIQQRLQAQAEAGAGFICATPGACQAGRFMSCDDPDRLGWDQISAFIARDGVFGFRLISLAKAEEIRSRLAELDCRFDTWDVFLASRAAALAASQAVLSRALPDGLIELAEPTLPGDDMTAAIQALMASAGVVPFSGSFLTGEFGPAATVAVGDRRGSVVAAAHGYMPHNAFSAYHRHAWGGLAAVAEAQRGKGLGTYINARMIVSVFRALGATHIYELVSATNIASRKMVEACGLRLEPALMCGAATPTGNARFTR
jgi:RimJ/RimL family protein N-acetyltransferase